MPKPESPIGESHPVPEQSSELPTNQERIPAIVESAQERTDAVTAVRTRLEQHAEQNEAGNHETSADAEHHTAYDPKSKEMKLFREFVRNPEQLLTGNFYDDLERVTAAREVVTDKLVKNAVATYGTVGLVLGGVATGLAWVGTGSALTTLVTGGAAFAIAGGSAVVGLGIAKLALYIRGKLLEAKAARLHK